jgi:hypothetical protein
MDWAEFSSVMRRATSVPRRPSESGDPVKVDEWIRYFGLDEDSFKK